MTSTGSGQACVSAGGADYFNPRRPALPRGWAWKTCSSHAERARCTWSGPASLPAPSSSSTAVAALAQSAARELARLLDADTPVPGVTTGALRPEIARSALHHRRPQHVRRRLRADRRLGTRFGSGQAVMPGQGRVVQRPYTPAERQSLNASQGSLGETTCDVHLNDRAYWRNVPAAVWDYKLGGYQVLKKWLSYRERAILGRPLTPDEIAHFTTTARRITAMLLVTRETIS